MNDAQLDIEQHFKARNFRPLSFPMRSGKRIEASRDPKLERWTILRDREPISGGPFTDAEALARLLALAGQAVGLIRIG